MYNLRAKRARIWIQYIGTLPQVSLERDLQHCGYEGVFKRSTINGIDAYNGERATAGDNMWNSSEFSWSEVEGCKDGAVWYVSLSHQ